MENKFLIVNADDFGQSPGINSGIIKAHEEGIVTSASLMVRYGAALPAASYAQQNSTLGVGLHVDLGEWTYKNYNWEPLYQVVCLDDEEAVEEEIKRQLDTFLALMKRLPTHIDSHQHVHHRETVLPAILKIADRLNITVRGHSTSVSYCGDFYGQCDDGSPYHDAISVRGLKKTIANLQEGITELACHPGLLDDIETLYRVEREKEVTTLCDGSLPDFIAKNNVSLRSFEGLGFHIAEHTPSVQQY
jgi:predicted glycoside hydrolase/deacetylase ChbG (UPF0249 family)